MIHKKRRKKPDPAKTTGRDNPNGGPSLAMMRAGNLIRAMEAKYMKLPSEDHQRLAMVEFGMAIAQEMKQTPDKVADHFYQSASLYPCGVIEDTHRASQSSKGT